MTHHSRLDKIVIDVAPADHDKEVAFWSAATGQQLSQSGKYPEYHWGEIPGQDIGPPRPTSRRRRESRAR
jgi:hypothetical protein